MTEKGEWEAFDLAVAAKIIRHISSGIYRTPGGAIKELVSNSFDAQASYVTIETGAPEYDQFKVSDYGVGMDETLIRRSFSHIGASLKASSPEKFGGKFDRPVIGQFGIGILAAAHISPVIHFTTYPASKPDIGLECELDLKPFLDLVNEIKTLEEVALGTVRFRTLPRTTKDKGTVVILKGVKRGSNFHRTISKKGVRLARWPPGAGRNPDNGDRMGQFVRAIQQAGLNRLEKLQGREHLLWDLGLICPVEYLPGGPVAEDQLKGK